jgi:hypothetical protein
MLGNRRRFRLVGDLPLAVLGHRNSERERVGKKVNVSIVAAITPPIIANAIDAQNTSRASGISANTAAAAVSVIGRNRRMPTRRSR